MWCVIYRDHLNSQKVLFLSIILCLRFLFVHLLSLTDSAPDLFIAIPILIFCNSKYFHMGSQNVQYLENYLMKNQI